MAGIGSIGATVVVEQAAAEALGLSVEQVRDMTLREFIDRATDRGLNVDVSMKASAFNEGHLSVTYRPDRFRAAYEDLWREKYDHFPIT